MPCVVAIFGGLSPLAFVRRAPVSRHFSRTISPSIRWRRQGDMHLGRKRVACGEAPPLIVDRMVRTTYAAIVADYRARHGVASGTKGAN
jgi:hypothetical protein